MNVAREAVHRVAEGEELTLADLGLLVMHLQTVGQAPPSARVLLRNDMLRVEWSTHQETQAEYDAQAEARRLEREQRATPTALLASDPSATDGDGVEEWIAAEAAEEPLVVPSPPRRRSGLV